MAVNWTDEQKQVINSRNSSLLVSAAAGSGKTAVLVERIISMISEGDHPLNIDQLLVMTFTNAAAAEMRERIGAAVEKKLREHPLDEHLWLQAALIPQAQIMTIDSFCLNLIRNHYNSLDIDPSFRIGDEGELTLLRGDVMEELLEACYQEENEDFIRFAEQFGAGKSDKAMEDVIVQAWQFSQSHPWPGEWLDECRQQLKQEAEGNLDESPWMKFLLKDTALQMEELTHQLQAALEVCREEGGPAVYEPMLENDLAGLLGIKKAAERGTFEKLYEALEGCPVTIRFLDPPLHEFVPTEEEDIKKLADAQGKSVEQIKAIIASLHEFNPMMGHRGLRLAVTYPEIAKMQTKAVIRAAINVQKAHPEWTVAPEIMIPLSCDAKELKYVKDIVVATADAEIAAAGSDMKYEVGTMIEIPRAALTAGDIAKEAEFFCFGTNDLTQMTYGFSRDDAGKFLNAYYDAKIFESDPFAKLDQTGVGQLMEMAVKNGKATRPSLHCGICGEHGGDPSSVEFCHKIGLDYVSCSPFRVPIARLAAAQAAIAEMD